MDNKWDILPLRLPLEKDSFPLLPHQGDDRRMGQWLLSAIYDESISKNIRSSPRKFNLPLSWQVCSSFQHYSDDIFNKFSYMPCETWARLKEKKKDGAQEFWSCCDEKSQTLASKEIYENLKSMKFSGYGQVLLNTQACIITRVMWYSSSAEKRRNLFWSLQPMTTFSALG